jgi:ketosteroid isomerase-like protein
MPDLDLVATCRRAMQAFNSNGVAVLTETLASDIVYTFQGQSPVAGEYCGIDAIRELVQRTKARTDRTASGSKLAVLPTTAPSWCDGVGRFRGTPNGRTFEMLHTSYYRFDRQGRVVGGHTIPVDHHHANQSWS